jgi:quercetin dioxygenase-like cupin family protein
MATPYAAATADHESLDRLAGGVRRVLLDSTQTDGRLAMSRLAAPAGTASVHPYPREDEIFVLMRGSGIFWAGDQHFELSEGGVAFLPCGVPHGYRITSDADLLALSKPGSPGLAPYAAGADQHETLEWLDGGLVRILLSAERTGGRLSLFRSTASAGSASPVYVHGREDEIVVMLSGSGIYWVGEHRYELSAGGMVFIPRGVTTAHRITTDAEKLTVTTPGGLEAFLRRAGRDVSQPRPGGWRISFDALVRAAAAAGQTILAAPLQADDPSSARLVAA